MIKQVALFLTAVTCLTAPAAAQSRNVFVMPPGDGVLRPVTVYTGDPFQPLTTTVSAAQDTFLALATPNGQKYYFIGRSGNDTVVVTDASFNVIARRSLGSGATAAAISPDGRYLIVLAGTVTIINTSTDQVQTQLDGGITPIDVAISRDGLRAFVAAQSGRVTAFDLNSLSTVGIVQNLGPVSGVTVGPNGLVYVSATNILYEMDPRDLSFRQGTGIPLNAQPGKPLIIADTFGNLRAVLINTNPGFGGSSAITIDLGTRVVTPLLASGVIFTSVVPVSGTRVLLTAQTGQLYDLNVPNFLQTAAFGSLPSTSNVRSVAVSNEFPSPRYAYLALSNNTISRVDLLASNVSGTFNLPSTPGNLSYAGGAGTGTIAALVQFNNGQFVNPASQTLPLIVRAVDANGRPLQGVPVAFTAITPGSSLLQSSTVTDAEGYAQAIAIAPNSLGAFQVSVTAGSAGGVVQTVTFNLTAGTGSAGPTGAVTIRSGNGQVIRESAITPELLRVVVRDAIGTPVPNALVNWSVTTANGPSGSLSVTQSITDFFGEATNTYIAPFLGPNLLTSYVQSTVNASTLNGSVNMFVTVIPNAFGVNPASLPTVQLLAPVNTETLTAQAGTTLPGAIQVRVSAGAGPGSGIAIPNVGVQVSTGLDPLVGPTARCKDDTALTDSSGLATCDLVVGGKIGSTGINISAAGQAVGSLNLIVTPGLPGKITPTQGDGQQGAPGETLPRALVATIEDSFGNLLPGANVNWTVEAGSATLVGPINRSDNLARVSTLVRLGNSPGAVRVRVTAVQGTSTAFAVFNLTVNISATQIRRVSGDQQTATVNQPFGSPLVAQVLNANGEPVPGIAVNFTASGGVVTLSSTTSVSDASGNVSVGAVAGNSPGTATVSASFGDQVTSWTLTVRPLGPIVSEADIINAYSGEARVSAGTIVLIQGQNIAPGVNGVVTPPSNFGPLPTSLSGVSVTFGSTPAPIYYVLNQNGREAIAVQVPYEVPDSGSVPVTITAGGAQATVNVTVSRYSPGILETTDAQGRKYAVVTRLDGSFVTPDSPLARGQQGRVYVTGLGRTTPPVGTNSVGAGQRVAGDVVVGINDQGVRVVSAEYAPNLVGIYLVTFEVPQNATAGSSRPFGLAVNDAGIPTFAQSSTIAIQ